MDITRTVLMSHFWTHEQMTYCNCGALSHTHTHCPCFHCNGKAVFWSTKHHHWQEANTERSQAISISHCCNTANSTINPCRLNQDLDSHLNGEDDAELTLMDTSTTSAVVLAEVIVTDHMDNLDGNLPARNNTLAR